MIFDNLPTHRGQKRELECTADEMIDDTLKMSSEEIRAEVAKLGIDPKAAAAQLRERVERGLRKHKC